MGRAVPFSATEQERELVRLCASVGISHEQMALMITRPGAEGEPKAISTDTLVRHFGNELAVGKAKTITLIAGRLVRTALGQNQQAGATVADELRAQMFYLKTQAGWREVDRQEVVFPDAGEDDTDAIAIASRIAGLIEKGRRKQLKNSGSDTVQ
jgi:hypothetical protein